MKIFNLKLSIEQIVAQLNLEHRFINNCTVDNVAELIEANNNSVCFFENKKYLDQLKASSPGLLFVPQNFDPLLKPDTNLIFTDKPYITFMMLVNQWLKLDNPKLTGCIDKSAVILDNAEIAKDVVIEANVYIGSNTKIGSGTIIKANTVVMDNCKLGKNTTIFPNTTIYNDCSIGDNCIIHAGCVIGADGFGFLLHKGKQIKIPQVGNVIIENNVEIGANSTVDRATLGSTIIGEGTKIDNLVQVGHNCKLGKHSILCAQVGLAGNTEIGDTVYLAGQVGVAGHLKIHDKAMIGAQSGVSNTIPEGAKCFGTPAIDAGLRKRIMAMEKYIPDVVKAYRRKEKNKV